MKILVTGGAGFIGSHLIDSLLAEGYQVVCIDNLSLGTVSNINHHLNNPLFKFIEGDLLDKEWLDSRFSEEHFEQVFHLAANSDIGKGMSDRSRDLNMNFITTMNVLECMIKSGVKRIVFSSTSAIYGEISVQKIKEDSGPIFPVSYYGASKLAAEGYISTYAHQFGLQALIVRFPNVVGPRSTHGILFDFLKKLEKDSTQLEVLGNGKQRKPYLHVYDLVQAILFCWKNSSETLNCYNIGPLDTVDVATIAKIVLEESGLNNTQIVYTGGERGWPGDVPFYEYDTSKLQKKGWVPGYNSEQSIRLSFRSLLDK